MRRAAFHVEAELRAGSRVQAVSSAAAKCSRACGACSSTARWVMAVGAECRMLWGQLLSGCVGSIML